MVISSSRLHHTRLVSNRENRVYLLIMNKSGSQFYLNSSLSLRCLRMPPMPFPMPLLFITAVKDICAINTFEKLLNILFSEVYCWYFGFTTLLFSATITDMSLYEVLNLFPRWPLVLRSFLHPPLVARDIVTPLAFSGRPCCKGGRTEFKILRDSIDLFISELM